jgi:hypothetical protein
MNISENLKEHQYPEPLIQNLIYLKFKTKSEIKFVKLINDLYIFMIDETKLTIPKISFNYTSLCIINESNMNILLRFLNDCDFNPYEDSRKFDQFYDYLPGLIKILERKLKAFE